MTTITIDDGTTFVSKKIDDDFEDDVCCMSEAFYTMLLGLGFLLKKSPFDMAMAVDEFENGEDEEVEEKDE